MPYTFVPPQQSSSSVHALLAANRLESRPRSPEFNRALRAEIRDPTWLLARQWQLHEFRAEDRGTPASVEATVREMPLSQLTLPNQPVRAYHGAHQPLEAAVEAQPRVIGAGLRLQMGQYWRRQLRAELEKTPAADSAERAARTAAVRLFAETYPLAAPSASAPVDYAQAGTTPEAQALLALAQDSGTALDGYALYRAFLPTPGPALSAALADSDQLETLLAATTPAQALLAHPAFSTPIAPSPARAEALAAGLPRLVAAAAALDGLARHFVLAFHRLYLLGAEGPGWATEDLAYGFGLGTAAGSLGTGYYPGGADLPWYAVDQQPAPAGLLLPLPAATTRRLLPTEVQFPGSPTARWWEFEDRRVDFGQVTGDPSDWGRMLLQEFMFLYQNDWFAVPYSVRGGAVCQVESLVVTDVFGGRYAIQPAGAGQLTEADGTPIDNDAHRWSFFTQTDAAHTGPAPAPALYVPAAVLAPLVSRPVEQVSLRREEATNLVWAVEGIVPDGFAGGLDGNAAAAQTTEALRRLVPTPDAGAASTDLATPGYAFKLASSAPENWLPFVSQADAATGTSYLEQGVLERAPGLALSGAAAFVQPRTALLQLRPGAPYRVHEHEVPPTGVRVDGLCYRARWYDGRTVLWFGRQRGVASLGGSSGLVFDQLQALGPA